MRLLTLVCLLAACGGAKSEEKNRTPATGSGQPATGNEIDAGAVAVATPDAGIEETTPAPDAGLMELGAAQCEMVIARLLVCPAIGAEIKDELRRKQAEIRQLAVDPKNREQVAAACRQLVEAMEETLRRLSC
jgi:hypothetical protein